PGAIALAADAVDGGLEPALRGGIEVFRFAPSHERVDAGLSHGAELRDGLIVVRGGGASNRIVGKRNRGGDEKESGGDDGFHTRNVARWTTAGRLSRVKTRCHARVASDGRPP